MSSGSQAVQDTLSPRITNGVKDVGVPAEDVKAIKHLIETIGNLASHKDYKLIASHFNEIARLQGVIEDKDKELSAYKTVNGTQAIELSSLKTKLTERNGTVAELEKQEEALQKQVRQLEETSKKQKEMLRKARDKVKDLENSLQVMGDRVKELDSNWSQEKSRALQLENELEGMENMNASLNQRLEANNGRLAELEGFAVQLNNEDLETSTTRMESLWERACRFVESYFQEDLSEESLRTSAALDRLRTTALFQHHVPLPPTNSVSAKKMRIAVILAILARSIDRHIFHPTYILEEDSDAREVLLQQAIRNSRKESFCRGLLLSISPDGEQEGAEQRVKQVIKDVMWAVQELLPADRNETFQSELEEFVRHACDTWTIMRRIKERFEPNFELVHLKDFEWQPLLFNVNSTSETDQPQAIQGRDDELLVVFPRLYIVENNHQPEPVTAGIVLRRSQSLAAAQELEEQPLSPTFSRATPNRTRQQKPRNLSISVQGNRSSESQAFLGKGVGSSEH